MNVKSKSFFRTQRRGLWKFIHLFIKDLLGSCHCIDTGASVSRPQRTELEKGNEHSEKLVCSRLLSLHQIKRPERVHSPEVRSKESYEKQLLRANEKPLCSRAARVVKSSMPTAGKAGSCPCIPIHLLAC